jgi:membrane protease subunit (stomatin/prohibitin family)
MIGRPGVVRRRPLLRAAAVGGTFAAGRAMGRRMAAEDAAHAAQAQRSSSAGSQQAQQAGTAQASAASSEASMMDQLSQLSMLYQQGALTDDEFAAAKAKVLGG